MGEVLFERYRPDVRMHTRIVRDRETGLPVIVVRQDTDAIVADARRQANAMDRHEERKRRTRSGGFTQVASIPLVIWRQLQLAGITRDERRLLAWLSQRETRWLRTDDGKRLA